MRLLSTLVMTGVLAALPGWSDAAGASRDARALYLTGLDEMTNGRWRDAGEAFTGSLAQSPEDLSMRLARGVAHTLAGQYRAAVRDLEGYPPGGPSRREAELWLYAAKAMSGVLSSGQPVRQPRRPPRTPAGSPGPPAALMQGGPDYPADYASCIAHDLALPHTRAHAAGAQPVSADIAKLKCGRWFAHRALSRPDLAAAHLARARDWHAAGRFEAALREVGYARMADPTDPEVVYYFADCWRALGRPATARKEYTVALTRRPDLTAAYLGRARAAAQLGDIRRARADLQTAAGLDPARAKAVQPTIDADLATLPPRQTVEEALARLEDGAGSGASREELIERALAVHLADAGQRRNYDEDYQDRLRQFEETLHRSPNRDAYIAMAQFLIDGAAVPADAVEPGREPVAYRWQSSAQDDFKRALRLLHRAWQLDRTSAQVLMLKAFALAGLGSMPQAEAAAEQARRLGAQDSDALLLYARFVMRRATETVDHAAALRRERCAGTDRAPSAAGRCSPPPPSDIQQASRFEAVAIELRRRAEAALDQMPSPAAGSVERDVIRASLLAGHGRLDEAVSMLEAVSARQPQSRLVHETLAGLYDDSGQAETAAAHRAAARSLIQTTAAPMLHAAWRRMRLGDREGAAEALRAAQRLDPVDARAPAYRGVLMESLGRGDEAAAAFRTALALEEARLRRDERRPPGTQPQPRDPVELGLAMAIRLHVGTRLEAEGRPAEALELYRANIAYEPYVGISGYGRPMFTALLPASAAPASSPLDAASLLAQSRFAAGRMLQATGFADEALAMFAAAAVLGARPHQAAAMVPPQPPAADATATVAFAKRALLAGDYLGAVRHLQSAQQASPPAALHREINAANMAIIQALNRWLHDDRTRESERRRQELIREAEVRMQQSASESRPAASDSQFSMDR